MLIANIIPLTVFAIQHTAALASLLITDIKMDWVTINVVSVCPIVFNALIVQVVQNATLDTIGQEQSVNHVQATAQLAPIPAPPVLNVKMAFIPTKIISVLNV